MLDRRLFMNINKKKKTIKVIEGLCVSRFRFSGFSKKNSKMGGGATKPKKVQNTDAKLREEYRSLKQKLLLAKRNGGNKKRIRRIRKEMSE